MRRYSISFVCWRHTGCEVGPPYNERKGSRPGRIKMYTLRKARESDYQWCRKVGHHGLKPIIERLIGWDQNREDNGFERHWNVHHIRIVQLRGQDVGYLKTAWQSGGVLIEGIYLDESFRSRGLGGPIIADVIAKARRPVKLIVHKTNPAKNLYQRLGFKITKENETRYFMTHANEGSV